MSGAKILFEQYKNGGADYIRSLIGKEVETELQEFKTFNSRNPNNWGSDDKKSLSESLSGFVNSTGGVIIWGVDCKKISGSDGPDVVQDVKPLPNLTAVLAQMNTLSASLVSPAIIGSIHHSIVDTSLPVPDTGYIVTYVPMGEGPPHMAMSSHKFMYRAGSSFLPMLPWMIADRFRERPQPKLELRCHFMDGRPPKLVIAIHNAGLGIAHCLAVAFNTSTCSYLDSPLKFSRFNLAQDYHIESAIQGERWFLFLADPDLYMIPGLSINAAGFPLLSVDPPNKKYHDIQMSYELYCDGFYKKGNLFLPGNEISQLPPR